MIDTILKEFGLNPEEIATYKLLLGKDPQTAGKIAKSLGKARSSVYGFLTSLQKMGLITESQKQKVKLFQAEDPEKINLLFEQKLDSINQAQAKFRKILPELKSKNPKLSLTPKFQVFQGQSQLQQILKDMLLYYDLETEAFWPISDMLEVLTPEFFHYLNKIRIKNNLYTRAIWPKNKTVTIEKHPYLGVGKDFKREIRVAPAGIEATMGYWAYGNRIAFISSRRENFGMIIESEELRQMLHAQFEILWGISKAIKVDKESTKKFIEELERYN